MDQAMLARIRHTKSLPCLGQLAPIRLSRSASETQTGTAHPLLSFQLTYHLPNFPSFPLPPCREAQTIHNYELPSPGSTPEPYAEQDAVALASETGNLDALDLIMTYFRRTGTYPTSA